MAFAGATAYTQPLAIQVFNAEYSTHVSGKVGSTIYVDRTLVSPEPVSDSFDLFVDRAHMQASATAGLFHVEGSAHSGWAGSASFATNRLWFSPVTDQTQTIAIEYREGGLPFCWGSVTLVDTTSNTELWNFALPADSAVYPPDYFTSVETDFFASHQYELMTAVGMGSSSDSESALIQVTGFALVPEPSTAFLLACGAACLVLRRRRCSAF